MSNLVDDPREESSRRSLLKKGLIAGGVAWTAPVITTLHSPVVAAVGSTLGGYTYCFEGGTTEGWTIDNDAGAGDGLWNVASDNPSEGTYSLHYGTGLTGTFNTGGRNAGSITSPPFTVPTSGSLIGSFDIWREVEDFDTGTWDEISLSVVGAAGSLYAESADGGNGPAYQTITFDLTGFTGTIQLAFFFDTGDGNFNGFRGIYIDNIMIPGATAPGGGGAAARGGQSIRPGWVPNRPAPTVQEQRRRDRIIRRETFEAGVIEDTELQAGVKSGQ